MSEYQHYEFQAIDQRLDERAQAELRGISSRADITATSFTNSYSYGDLRGDPREMLDRWFDAFLHLTSWGTRWLAFRLPASAVSAEALDPYEGELFSVEYGAEYTSLHLHLEPEGATSDWVDAEGLLDRLIPLRDALAAGDLRCLYLVWLVEISWQWFEVGQDEPPVPPGLGDLDAAHRALVEFMGVDQDLLEAAAENSPPLVVTVLSGGGIRAQIAALDSVEKDRWLLQVLEGNGRKVRWDLRRRLGLDSAIQAHATHPARAVEELLQRAEVVQEERIRREQQGEAARRHREAAARAVLRRRHLDGLVGREDELWQSIDDLIATRKPKAYDTAVDLVTDLRDLAELVDEGVAWAVRIAAFVEEHRRKSSLMRRLARVTAVPAEACRRR